MSTIMKRLCTSLLVLAVAATAAAYAQSGGATEKEVLQTMNAMDQAEAKRDKAALERLHAEEYLFHGSNGRAYTKAQSIADTMAGTTTWTDRKNDGLKVRISPETSRRRSSWRRRRGHRHRHGDAGGHLDDVSDGRQNVHAPVHQA